VVSPGTPLHWRVVGTGAGWSVPRGVVLFGGYAGVFVTLRAVTTLVVARWAKMVAALWVDATALDGVKTGELLTPKGGNYCSRWWDSPRRW
jgi:hypothetical protein